MNDLFFEDAGNKSAPPLLYLHGGPGTGSYDFTLHQKDLLTDKIRLISLDQRGVLRSEPIPDKNALRLADLVKDIESVRDYLNIEKWSVLGHSFGGYLGLLYSMNFPNRVDKLIFENASFDVGSSARSLLKRVALEYAAIGESSKAEECLDAVFSSGSNASQIWERFTELSNGLGPLRNNVYFHGVPANYFDKMVRDSPFSEEQWSRGLTQQRKLFEEGAIFKPLLEKPEELPKHRCLIIRGMFDSVLPDDQIHKYIKSRPGTELTVFRISSHFPHLEQPEEFALQVKGFILSA